MATADKMEVVAECRAELV